MGLQYVDSTGAERTLTEADMVDPSLGFGDAYSDLFKVLNGFRPRGDYFWQPSVMLAFFDDYERQIAYHLAREEEEDRRRLADMREEHNMDFATLGDAYRHVEALDAARWEAELAVMEAAKALKIEFARRGSPLPYIEAWEYGSC